MRVQNLPRAARGINRHGRHMKSEVLCSAVCVWVTVQRQDPTRRLDYMSVSTPRNQIVPLIRRVRVHLDASFHVRLSEHQPRPSPYFVSAAYAFCGHPAIDSWNSEPLGS